VSNEGGVLTLKPDKAAADDTFTVKVSGNAITELYGPITYDNGDYDWITIIPDTTPITTTGTTNGELVITGIPDKYNGKYVMTYHLPEFDSSATTFIAAGNITGTNMGNLTMTGGQIDNGSVTLKVLENEL
jgi:hypothetical protein